MTIRVGIFFFSEWGMQFRNSTWPDQNSRELWNCSQGMMKAVAAVIFNAIIVLLDVAS